MRKIKILLVEDDLSLQELFKAFLLHYTAFFRNKNLEDYLWIADNSKKAIELIKQHHFDYISLDGELNKNTHGCEILEYLKTHKKDVLKKVIFSSAKPGLNEDIHSHYGVRILEKIPNVIKKEMKRIDNILLSI